MKDFCSMKSLCLLLLSVMLSAISAHAQTLRYGITAGLAVSDAKDFKPFTGFSAGVKGELLPAGEDVSGICWDAALLLTQRGWKDEVFYDDLSSTRDIKCKIYYLELPVHVGYRQVLNDRFAAVYGIGPYVGWGLWGGYKLDGDSGFDVNVFTDDEYRRFDWGAGLSVALETRRLQIGASYDISFRRPNKVDLPQFNGKSKIFRLSLSYIL